MRIIEKFTKCIISPTLLWLPICFLFMSTCSLFMFTCFNVNSSVPAWMDDKETFFINIVHHPNVYVIKRVNDKKPVS